MNGFVDREDAGRRLAAELRSYAGERPIILALPRGGVPVGHEIARALEGRGLGTLLFDLLTAPEERRDAIDATCASTYPCWRAGSARSPNGCGGMDRRRACPAATSARAPVQRRASRLVASAIRHDAC